MTDPPQLSIRIVEAITTVGAVGDAARTIHAWQLREQRRREQVLEHGIGALHQAKLAKPRERSSAAEAIDRRMCEVAEGKVELVDGDADAPHALCARGAL